MTDNISRAVYSAREGAGWTNKGRIIRPEIAHDPRLIAEECEATWNVIAKPLYTYDEQGFAKVGGFVAQTRSDNGHILTVTSEDRYHTVNRQPVDIFEAFRDALWERRMEISHGALLRGGRIVVVCALLPQVSMAGDKIVPYVTLATGYDKQHGTKALAGGTRVVCENTYNAATYEAQQSGHYRSIRASSIIGDKSELVALIDQAIAGGQRQLQTFDALANERMTDVEVQRLFADVLKIDLSKVGQFDKQGKALLSTRATNALKALTESYKSAPGAVQGTAWGAYNAVTYFGTHLKSVRDTQDDGADAARLASNLFGDAAAIKARALALLSERVKLAA